MYQYRVTHNGYTVEFFEDIEKVNAWIDSKLHKDLNPKMVVSQHVTPWKVVRIYQYYTLYSEMFFIEIMNEE